MHENSNARRVSFEAQTWWIRFQKIMHCRNANVEEKVICNLALGGVCSLYTITDTKVRTKSGESRFILLQNICGNI